MASSVKDITAKLEQGVKALFDSEKYAEYLRCMSRFHNYSSRNVMLIYAQHPGATHLAGFQAWRRNWGRQVKKGEHGIKILAPVPFNETKEFEKLDPVTKQPILDENGQPVMETLMRMGAGFRPVTIFDVSQTEGDPLPELAEALTGDVERYELFMDALRAVSPLPIVFEDLPPDKDGVCRFGNNIAIRDGMSQTQTVSAVIHEIAHAKLHDRELNPENANDTRREKEVTAESISYCVCQRYSIETGANSFGYVGEWLSGKEMKELNASLDVIRKTASELIESIDESCRALAKERGIDLSVVTDELGAERDYNMIGGGMSNEALQVSEMPARIEPETPAAPDILAAYARNAEVRDPRQVGEAVLMTLLFEGGGLNRGNKRSRVKVEPTIGKYEIFSRDEGTPPYLTNYLYAMTASGRLAMLGETERLKDLTEERLDEYILALADSFEKQLASPTEWADFTAAAFLDRIDEAEAHNAPVREMREAERQTESDARRERNKRLTDEKREIFDARVDEIAKAVERGERIKVGYDAGAYDGKNPVLELFRLYGVDIPLRTRGWVNKRLAEINGDSYSFYTRGGGKASSAFMDALSKLVKAVKLTPIEQRRGAEKPAPSVKMEVKRTLEHELYEKFAALFPDVMSGVYSHQKFESDGFEPLSIEWIGTGRLSVMQTYVQEGDLMYDPMIVYEVDRENRTMTAVEYEQSNFALYQRVTEPDGSGSSVDGHGRERKVRNLQSDIDEFSGTWFNNLEEQDFKPVSATLADRDEDTLVSFDADGNPMTPEARESAEAPEVFDNDRGLIANINGYIQSCGRVYDVTDDEIRAKIAEIREKDMHGLTYRDVGDFILNERTRLEFESRQNAAEPEIAMMGGMLTEVYENGDDPMPDPIYTIEDMRRYGYTDDGMLPLQKETALELYDQDHTVYLLCEDGTEAIAYERGEIERFEGFFGIEREEWESIVDFERRKDRNDNFEGGKEALLIYGADSQFGIYQLRDDIDEAREPRGSGAAKYLFTSMRELEALGLSVDRASYELVYTGKLDIHDTLTNKDRIFDAFQRDSPECPQDFTGRSVSVSDVIVLQWRGEVSAHYVDSIGFVELESFTGNERERTQDIRQEPQTFSQVGKRPQETVPSPEVRQPPQTKGRPDFLAKLNANKQRVERESRGDTAKTTERGGMKFETSSNFI
jgi:hypothetical protein